MLLPLKQPPPQQTDHLKTHKFDLKSALISHRALLLLLVLVQLLLVAFVSRSRSRTAPATSPIPLLRVASPIQSVNNTPRVPLVNDTLPDPCESRRIYVYDLPAVFNSDLKENCEKLDPWRSKCVANLNDGLGPHAKELHRVVPDNLIGAWYWTDHYWGEVVYHKRMLNYKCRTMEPESAAAYYIPFYVGLAVGNYLWDNRSVKEKDEVCEKVLTWLAGKESFRRSNGSDHFIMLGRLTWDFRRKIDAVNDWGSSFLHMQGMQNVIRLSVEKNPWDPLEIAVPYPTIFHPRSDKDVAEWQGFVRSRNRTRMFSYVGGARKTIKDDFRSILEEQCRNATPACRHVDCSRENCLDGTTAIMSTFLNSDFCLQPRGDGYTRRSVFDCMMAGSIPVFFWKRTAYEQYEWFVPGDPGSYSVFIDRSEVRSGKSIKGVLEGYSREKVETMREKVIEYIPRFVYAKPNEGLQNTRDAFDVAINGIFTKFEDHMRNGRLGHRD